MKFRKNYIPSNDPGICFLDSPSRVQPQFADELDVNNIMAKYARTGVLPDAGRQALFMDVSDGVNFEAMQDKVLTMNRLFDELPSEVRAELRTPVELYNALSDPSQRSRLERLGVLSPPAAPPTAVADSVASATQGEKTP